MVKLRFSLQLFTVARVALIGSQTAALLEFYNPNELGNDGCPEFIKIDEDPEQENEHWSQ